jgi:phosphonopyruvate decarboxylase
MLRRAARFAFSRLAQEPPYLELQRDFLDPAEFYKLLTEQGVDFYSGVPDSLLKDFLTYLSDTVPAERNIITANEGTALSLAVGYHLAT